MIYNYAILIMSRRLELVNEEYTAYFISSEVISLLVCYNKTLQQRIPKMLTSSERKIILFIWLSLISDAM